MGISADGERKAAWQPGFELRAAYTLFAEGCRGHLGKELIARYGLATGTQHYGIGLKELWDVDPERHVPGRVVHTLGWPARAHGDTRHRRRRLPLPPGERAGRRRPDRRPVVPQPAPESVRRVSALQAPPDDRGRTRGRHARGVRRPRRRQGRAAGPAEDDLPGRHADRRRRGLPQPAQGEGLAHGHEVRNAGRRDRLRRARPDGPQRRTRGLRRALQEFVAVRGAAPLPQRRPDGASARHPARRGLRLVRPAHRPGVAWGTRSRKAIPTTRG